MVCRLLNDLLKYPLSHVSVTSAAYPHVAA
jgi:hypothetical protein